MQEKSPKLDGRCRIQSNWWWHAVLGLAASGLALTAATLLHSPAAAQEPPPLAPPSRAQTPPAPQAAEIALLLLVPASATAGIAPIVAEQVTQQLRRSVAAMGYRLVDAPTMQAALQSVAWNADPNTANLWRAAVAANAQRGMSASVWAEGGLYVVEITVASGDGSGPFVGRQSASAAELLGAIDRLTRQTLPPPTVWNADEARRWRSGTHPAQLAAAAPMEAPAAAAPLIDPELRLRQNAERRRLAYRFHLALQLNSSFGIHTDFFYNQLLGARLDWRLNPNVLLGVYLGYANLLGRIDRAHNLLTYLQLEYRQHFSPKSDISMPLRLAVGYLPYNGPVLRTAIGLNVPIGKRFEFGLDALAPTFWFIPGGPLLSLDVAVELILRL